MFAGRGQQSLVLTLTPDFRKVRHILFGSEYGAKVNIFKWINYPLLWVESRILILFWQLLYVNLLGKIISVYLAKKIHSGHHARFWDCL